MKIGIEIRKPSRSASDVAISYNLHESDRAGSGRDDMILSEVFQLRFLIDGVWEHRAPGGDWERTPMAALWGPGTAMMGVRTSSRCRLLSIPLRVAGCSALFDQPPAALVDRMTPLVALAGDGVAELQMALGATNDLDGIAAAVDRWLTMRLREADPARVAQRWSAELERIAVLHWDHPVADLAAAIGLSVRQFERLSTQYLGYNPKMLTRCHRFLNMASALRGVVPVDWHELCYRYYADQSHMSREFRQFTGMAPGVFRDMDLPLLDAQLRQRRWGHMLMMRQFGLPGGQQDLYGASRPI